MSKNSDSLNNKLGTSRHIAVICQKSKDLYLSNPKLVQRLPKQQRAYWYWFLKNH